MSPTKPTETVKVETLVENKIVSISEPVTTPKPDTVKPTRRNKDKYISTQNSDVYDHGTILNCSDFCRLAFINDDVSEKLAILKERYQFIGKYINLVKFIDPKATINFVIKDVNLIVTQRMINEVYAKYSYMLDIEKVIDDTYLDFINIDFKQEDLSTILEFIIRLDAGKDITTDIEYFLTTNFDRLNRSMFTKINNTIINHELIKTKPNMGMIKRYTYALKTWKMMIIKY